jgi:hypothetical protein
MRHLALLSCLFAICASSQTLPIAAYPPYLNLSASAGADPVLQPIAVAPNDPAASWTASSTADWLILSDTAGAGQTTLTVSTNAASFPPGLYTAKVQFKLADGSTAPVVVTLRLGLPTAAAPAKQWHVTVDGAPEGDGSAEHPWDIVTALNGPAQVKPGDTIWLHGGKYGSGTFDAIIASRLVGTREAPIIVRAAPGERPIVDAWLQVGCCDGAGDPAKGSYAWFWGVEFASYNPDRTSGASGPPDYAKQQNHAAVDVWAPGTKIINCIVHDTSGGIEMWQEAEGAEAYGNLVYNVGGYGPDRGHGHGFYLQNAGPGFKHIFDNITFNNFGEGMQIYGSDLAPVENFHLEGNVSFNNGAVGTGSNSANGTPAAGSRNNNIIIGEGRGGPKGILLINNFLYHTPQADDGTNELGYPWTPRAGDLTAIGNFFVGGSDAVDLIRWDSLVFRDNQVYAPNRNNASLTWRVDQNPARYSYDYNYYYGSGRFTIYAGCNDIPCAKRADVGFNEWQSMARIDTNSVFSPGQPNGMWINVRPNLYEPGRANVVVYNWNLWTAATIDLRNAGLRIGDNFEIRDAQNWFAEPVYKGVYLGQQVTIDMTGRQVAAPNGNVPHPQPHTCPQFGVFVITSGQ